MEQHDRPHHRQAQQGYVRQQQTGDESRQSQQQYGLPASTQYASGTVQIDQEAPISEARQDSQQYAQYGSNLIYSMGQAQGASQYRQPPSSGSETLPAQFGVPQYYLAGQAIPGGGTLSELSTAQLPSQYAHPGGYPETMPYNASLIDPSQPGAYNPYTQQPQYAAQLQVSPDEQAFETYQAQIRNVFTLARNGTLIDVGSRLLDVSQYLLGNVEALGLTRDDDTLHDGRIQLWDEFNRAWLVSLQKQFDLAQQVFQENQPLAQSQSIMDAPSLERLSTELVRLCDNIEKHGLVDYQMGVAEEEIMELLLRCLSQLNGKTTRTPRSGEASAAGASGGR